MLRRNMRMRREYLYHKSLEGKERLVYENKRKIFKALAVPHSTIDDEYENAADRDPKILLTTSRNPSAPLTQFVKNIEAQSSDASQLIPQHNYNLDVHALNTRHPGEGDKHILLLQDIVINGAGNNY